MILTKAKASPKFALSAKLISAIGVMSPESSRNKRPARTNRPPPAIAVYMVVAAEPLMIAPIMIEPIPTNSRAIPGREYISPITATDKPFMNSSAQLSHSGMVSFFFIVFFAAYTKYPVTKRLIIGIMLRKLPIISLFMSWNGLLIAFS